MSEKPVAGLGFWALLLKMNGKPVSIRIMKRSGAFSLERQKMDSKEKPIVGVTMGDPAGIGPEIVIKAVFHPEILRICRPVVVGDKRVVKQALEAFGAGAGMKVLPDISHYLLDPDRVNVFDTANVDPDRIETGRASAAGGRAVFEDIQRAVKMTEEKDRRLCRRPPQQVFRQSGGGPFRRVSAPGGQADGEPARL